MLQRTQMAFGIACIIMAGALVWGFAAGDLFAEGPVMLRMPWALVSLVEIYVGMTLFGCWLFWRESSVVRACGWLLATIFIGNAVSCVYALLAARSAQGDPVRFWMGARVPREHLLDERLPNEQVPAEPERRRT
ncbi:MAG: hypothetical protein ACI9W2_003347 [Gammaproteobacteria bacterium]|jgi:hypothetical protein